ncbi:MAG: methyltransferase domain-containing protein [Deltaproteobacteria bacterium]|nr:methyltransferase domain-containing protein [Deltaproteobacteria bacterium]
MSQTFTNPTSKLPRAAAFALGVSVLTGWLFTSQAAAVQEPAHQHSHGENHQGHGNHESHGNHEGHEGQQEAPSMDKPSHHQGGSDHGTSAEGDEGHVGHAHGSQGMHHDFSDAERWYQIFEGDDRDQWQRPVEVVFLMQVQPGMTVADIGAGTGYFLPYLAAAVGPQGKVLGLDPEANLVHFMKERANQQGWSNAEIRRIPFDSPQLVDGSTDRILIVNTWHHIEDRPTYSATLAKTLTPDGRIYVVDFTKESPRGPSVNHRLPPEQVIKELRRGGLEAEVVDTDLPWQYVVVARKR